MEFEESVKSVAAKVADLKDSIETEEATKTAFIMPFIGQVLGYDVFNPTEVVPEFTADVGVKKGEKVDYALVLDEQARIDETLKKLHRGDMDIVALEDEHKYDGDGDEPA